MNYGSHPPLNPDLVIFLKDTSTSRDRACLHNLTHISGKTDRIFIKNPILHFGSHPAEDSGSGTLVDPHRIRPGGALRSPNALVCTIVHFLDDGTVCLFSG